MIWPSTGKPVAETSDELKRKLRELFDRTSGAFVDASDEPIDPVLLAGAVLSAATETDLLNVLSSVPDVPELVSEGNDARHY